MSTKQELLNQLESLLTEVDKLSDKINSIADITKWEPKEGTFIINQSGIVFKSVARDMPNTAAFGFSRDTRKKAEQAASTIRSYARLLAYVDEFETAKGDYVIYYDTYYKSYKTYFAEGDSCILGEVRMSKECAKALSEKLNSGEVVL